MAIRSVFSVCGAALFSLGNTGAVYAQSDPASAEVVLNPLRSLDKSSLSGFRQRPLFNPARAEPPAPTPAPPPIVAPAAPPPPEPPPRLRLLGIVQGGRDIAVIRRDDGSPRTLVASGDRFAGWTVTVTSPSSIRIEKDGQVADFTLFSPGSRQQ